MALRESTDLDEVSGHALYRRRMQGRTVLKRTRRGAIVELDNRWVVPYNPYLLGKYNCHINVEICSSSKSVKYLHKYVFKGPDRGVIEQVQDGPAPAVDEIQEYKEGRSACCA